MGIVRSSRGKADIENTLLRFRRPYRERHPSLTLASGNLNSNDTGDRTTDRIVGTEFALRNPKFVLYASVNAI